MVSNAGHHFKLRTMGVGVGKMSILVYLWSLVAGCVRVLGCLLCDAGCGTGWPFLVGSCGACPMLFYLALYRGSLSQSIRCPDSLLGSGSVLVSSLAWGLLRDPWQVPIFIPWPGAYPYPYVPLGELGEAWPALGLSFMRCSEDSMVPPQSKGIPSCSEWWWRGKCERLACVNSYAAVVLAHPLLVASQRALESLERGGWAFPRAHVLPLSCSAEPEP